MKVERGTIKSFKSNLSYTTLARFYFLLQRGGGYVPHMS